MNRLGSPPLEKHYRAGKSGTWWLGLLGAVVTAGAWGFELAWTGRTPDSVGVAAAGIAAAVIAGLVLRSARRKILHGQRLSWHQAFSFDAVFQGAILINPQLPFPEVEREFIVRETGLPPDLVKPWFGVRPISAVVIPLFLASLVMGLASWFLPAGLLFLAAGGAAIAGAVRSGSPEASRTRLGAAVLCGLAGVALEGAGFCLAAQAVNPDIPLWQAFLIYSLILTAFELSPIPFALGVLEVVYFLPALLPGFVLPGLAFPMAYRLFRGGFVLLVTLFYLPRYKLKVSDLFDPRLAIALALSQRPQQGRQESASEEGPLLSIVIPAYNEEQRLPTYLPDVVAFAEALEESGEVLVVDDGSLDGTAAYVAEMAARHPVVRLLKHEFNQGKGAAVRRGALESRGRFVLFTDADGATPIREAEKLLSAARQGIEVVIGSRTGVVERSRLRRLMGLVFYRLTNLLAVPSVSDTQCGFKLFRRSAARRIFPVVREKGWAFDVEVLFLAQKLGMAIQEVAVEWRAVAGSKISPVRDSLKMIAALWRIRRHGAGLVESVPPRRAE